MNDIIKQRFEKVYDLMCSIGLDGLYITNITNIKYLTGFTGSAAILLIIKDKCYFISDGRYTKQASEQVRNAKISIIEKSYFDTIKNLKILEDNYKIGFESNNISFTNHKMLVEAFPKINWYSTESVIEDIQSIKDKYEINSLKKAAEITDYVFEKIIDEIKAGLSEKFIAARIAFLFKTNGAEGESYDSIIASGPNAALPHARPTDRKFTEGDFIVMDFGALFEGYHADMTRTVMIGKPTQKHQEIYDIVSKSQMSGISHCKSGVKCSDVDKACRSVINQHGYGDFFNHSTGHGIGLEVHALPRIHHSNQELLKTNQVITIEPGIYIPDWGGVRIEDDCVINDNDCSILNKSTKELISL